MSEQSENQNKSKGTQAVAAAGLALKATGGTGLVIAAALALFLVIFGVLMGTVLLFDSDTQADEAQSASTCVATTGNGSNIPAEYEDVVTWAAKESGLPKELIAAQVDNESEWVPTASSGRAFGIAQFTPETFAAYGEGDIWDPHESIKAQGRYMKALMDMYADQAADEEEQLTLALAAYNAGPGRVQQYGGVPPFEETQNYIRDIPAAAQLDFSEDCTPPGGLTVGDLGTGEWTHPLPGGHFTSGYGPRPCPAGTQCNEYVANHHGIDFATGGGAQVVAPTDMEVTATGTNQYQGEYVIGRMTDDPGLVFQFHHCQSGSTSVRIGDVVAVGTGLCIEGNTGNTSGGVTGGHHLHFQINLSEADDTMPTYTHTTDPEPILIERGVL